jgi:hypothetical protein
VLVAEKGGGGQWMLAPKEGGSVTIKNPELGTIRVWAVNELATIDVPYPGVGFVPTWMQKSIRLAIVSEGDWEPLLNRSPHRARVMSPDMVSMMKEIADGCKDQKVRDRILDEIQNISTSPSREMIADPSTLGNLMQSSVMKALATVSNDLMDILKQVSAKIGKVQSASPTIVYIGLGLIVILTVVALFKILPMAEDLLAIKQSLGIPIQ